MRRMLWVVGLILVSCVAIIAVWGKNFIWYEIPGTRITINDEEVPTSALYKSFESNYILLIEINHEEKALYVIRPDEGAVGLQSRGKFIRLPICLISTEYPVYPIGRHSEKSISIDPHLVVDEMGIRFSDYPSDTVSVQW